MRNIHLRASKQFATFKAGADWVMAKTTWVKGLFAFVSEHFKAIAIIVGTSGVLAGGAVVTVAVVSDPRLDIPPGFWEILAVKDETGFQIDLKFQKVAESHSLNITQEADTTLVDFTLDGARLGAPAIGTVIEVTADDISGYFLFVENFLIDGLACPTFELGDSEIHNLVIGTGNNVDGASIANVTDTTTNYAVASTRGAGSVDGAGGSYDKFIYNASLGNTRIQNFTLSNIDAFGGDCKFSRIKAGTMTLTNMTIGDGSGIDSSSFNILSSVTVTNFSNAGITDDQPVDVI